MNCSRGCRSSRLPPISIDDQWPRYAFAVVDLSGDPAFPPLPNDAHKQKRRLGRGGVFVSGDNVKRDFFVLGRPGGDLLSQGLSHSTIGAEEFNGRVRDGIGFRLLARTTRPAKDKGNEASRAHFALVQVAWTLKMRAIKPIERLVPVSYMHYCTSTPGLSTWSSSTVLKGMLVLRWVSRLDAFSGYPVRT